MPALCLSHGAPPLADDPVWPGELAAWAAALPGPKAVLVVSAHWEEAPLALGATRTVPLAHDFWRLPERYCQVRCEARRALEAGDVDGLLDFARESPAGLLAHPRTEHFAPLFATMGAADAAGELELRKSVIDGFWTGPAKRSVQFGRPPG